MSVHFILKKHGESLESFAKRLNLSRPTATKLVQEYDKGNDVSEEYKILFQEIEKRENVTDEEFESYLSQIYIPQKTKELVEHFGAFIQNNQRGIPLSDEDLILAKDLSSYMTALQVRKNDEDLLELFDKLPDIKRVLYKKIPVGPYSVSDIKDFSISVAEELSTLLPNDYSLRHFPFKITFANLDNYIQSKGEILKYGDRLSIQDINKEEKIEKESSADFHEKDITSDREPVSPKEEGGSAKESNKRIITLGLCIGGGREIIYHSAFRNQKKYCGHTVFEVALHEVFHWFQHELANAIVNRGAKADIVEKELKAYKYRYNFDHYIQPWVNFDAYRRQLVEKDARWFADYVYSVQKTSKPNTAQKFNKTRATINEINKLKGQLLHREEIYKKLKDAIPDFKRGSFQLTDYCYNRINEPIKNNIKNNILKGKKAVFLFEQQTDENYYKVLGEGYPYSGVIYEKPRGSELQMVKEFQWQNGKIINTASGEVLFESTKGENL